MDECISRQECKTCQEKYDEINNNQNRRLDALEENVKQIQALTISVEKMAVSIEQMTKELTKQGQRLEAIEAEPGEKWKQAVWIVISVIITATVTLFLSRIGIK